MAARRRAPEPARYGPPPPFTNTHAHAAGPRITLMSTSIKTAFGGCSARVRSLSKSWSTDPALEVCNQSHHQAPKCRVGGFER